MDDLYQVDLYQVDRYQESRKQSAAWRMGRRFSFGPHVKSNYPTPPTPTERPRPAERIDAELVKKYAALAKDMFVSLLDVGFDPYLGFYHQPRYGRPTLALDMMEEFRPVIADSTAINLFNNLELSEKDFIKIGMGVSLISKGKRKAIRGYERRMEEDTTHPLFGYTISYRRILEVQARLLSRVISGEIKEYPAFYGR